MQLSPITLRQFNCKHFFRNTLKQITNNLLQRIHMGYPGAGVAQPLLGVRNKCLPGPQVHSLFAVLLRSGLEPRLDGQPSLPAEPRQILLARSQFYQHKRSRNPMTNQTRLFWVMANPSADLQLVSSSFDQRQAINIFKQKSWPVTCTVFRMMPHNTVTFPIIYLTSTTKITIYKLVWKWNASG